MRYLLLALLPGLALYLQSTLFQHVKVNGVLPDIVLIFTVFFALMNGGIRGGIYGICCGLLEDLYVGRMIGINVLCKGLIGYLLGKTNPQINPESPWIGPLEVLAGGILNAVLFGFFIAVFDIYTADMKWVLEVFLIQIAYQVMLSIPLYLWYHHSHTQGWLKPAEEEERLWNRMTRLVK